MDTRPTPDPRPTTRRRVAVAVAGVVVLALVAGLLALRPGAGPTPVSEPAPGAEEATEPYVAAEVQGQLAFAVDPSLAPAVTEVAGVHEGDAPRPTARLVDSEGRASDLVLGELVVTTADPAALDRFVARWGGSVVDRLPATAPGDPVDHLVRLDPSGVDAAAGPDALLALEPHQPGTMRFSHGAALDLVALAALDGQRDGLVASPVWLTEATALPDGVSIEAPDSPQVNAFEWSYLRDGGALDIGVAPAWQLLDLHDRLDGEKVEMMVVDGGFYPNPDFPDEQKIRKGQWRDVNPMRCGGGALCPWHGSHVVTTAMGRLDNGYGVAGPAGPVASLVALVADTDSFTRLKKVREVAEEERPDIVNMSYMSAVTAFRSIANDTYSKHLGAVRDGGAVLFAAAGNDGIDVDSKACVGKHCYESLLVVPCETTEVICVGGTRGASPFKADGSNFGSVPGLTSVELWAPYCYRVMNDAGDPYYETETTSSCGTSYSSPFVAGIAALLLAADPDLSPSAVRQTLYETAHVGGVHFPDLIPEQGQRRVDAMAAVERVLGVSPAPPSVQIDAPTEGASFPLETWLELEATATSFTGGPLPVTWTSSIDGDLGTSDLSGDLEILPLSRGTHVLTAWTADTTGQPAIAQVTIEYGNNPPTVAIGGGLDGSSFYEGQTVDLLGFTSDIDLAGALPDEAVRWEVRRNGTLVHEAGGHIAQLPPALVDAGAYHVAFIADDDGLVVSAEASFTVEALPPGENPPNVQIISPTSGDVYGVHGGTKAQVHLVGAAVDPQDGQVSGTRFRWTATSQAGTTVVLCEGSSFPGAGGGGGGYAVLQDCSDVWVEMFIDPAALGDDGLLDPTLWTVTLTVADSAGITAQRSVGITVKVIVG